MFSIKTADSGVAGMISVKSGVSTAGSSGAIALATGDATGGAGGSVSILVGSGSGTGGNVNIQAGDATGASGGNVLIRSGNYDDVLTSNRGSIELGTASTSKITIGGNSLTMMSPSIDLDSSGVFDVDVSAASIDATNSILMTSTTGGIQFQADSTISFTATSGGIMIHSNVFMNNGFAMGNAGTVPYIEKMAIGVFGTCEISLSSSTYSQDCTMTLSETVLISQPASESGAVMFNPPSSASLGSDFQISAWLELVDTSCTEECAPQVRLRATLVNPSTTVSASLSQSPFLVLFYKCIDSTTGTPTGLLDC